MPKQPDIKKLLKEALLAMEQVADAKAAEGVFLEYAGKKGRFKEALRSIGSLPQDKRKSAGRAIQAAYSEFKEAVDACIKAFGANALSDKKEKQKTESLGIDVTIPTPKVKRGGLHVLTFTRREIDKIFLSMGFSIATGPQVETAHYNFDALNIPPNHPARDLWDTFWLEEKKRNRTHGSLLMRTHTSPVQIRYMENNPTPFRIIAPGETYRYEATDASHEFQFMQIEGLMVDRRDSANPVSMQTLLSVLTQFFSEFFRTEVELRVRPSYFPFVEPGIEVDMSCVFCERTEMGSKREGLPAGRQGCSVCSKTGWLEMGGAGMVHPNVFKAVGYNPKNVQGFAFGFGIERLAMLKYGIPDVRLFRTGDLKFLEQFKK